MVPMGEGRGAARAVRKREASETDEQAAQTVAAVRVMSDLLEEYAPTWYSQELHEKAAAAVNGGKEKVAEVFVELHNLLENYSPSWYTEDTHLRAESLRQSLKLS